MFLYNLKLVFRNLLKNKLYSFLSIAGFAVGFAVCIIIAIYAYNEFTFDHCHPNYTRIYRLFDKEKSACAIDYNLNKLLAENNPEVELSCPFEMFLYDDIVKSGKNYTRIANLGSTNNSFFKLFSIQVLSKLAEEPFEGKASAVITESLAKRLFKKDENPLGKNIEINYGINATISAVIKDFQSNSSINLDVLLNSENVDFRLSNYCIEEKCINPVNHYLLLNEKVNPDEFVAKLNRNINQYSFAVKRIDLQKLSDIYLYSSFDDNENLKGNKNLVLIFIGIGILIILLSIINYMNYNLSLQYAKLKEIGVKRINGAGFHQLIGYSITEVTVGILISIDIALLIVALLLPYVNRLLGKHLILDVLYSPYMLIFSAGIVIFLIVVNSIIPLYILSKFNISTFFSGKNQAKGRLRRRDFLTTLQFTIAISLLSCVLIIQKQLGYALNTDLGFNKEHTLKLTFPFKQRNAKVLKQEFGKFPFVINSAISRGAPGEVYFRMESGDTSNNFIIACIYVDTDFINTLDIKITQGRWFLNGDIGKACIINQTALKRYGWKDINNRWVKGGDNGNFEVVGVAKDFYLSSFHEALEPMCLLFCPIDSVRNGMLNLSLRVTPGEVDNKVKQIEMVWEKLIPDNPMNFTFYDTMFDSMYRKEKLLATIIMIFSVIAIVLSCMGVLGQIFQTCINRTKEIGIRKVNGATVFTIIQMLNLDFVKLILIAFTIACPLSYYIMGIWLQNFAYKTSMSWWIFVLAGLIVLVISLIIVTLQSWRTANQNPVEALRYE